MIVTASVLAVGVTVVVAAQVSRHRTQDPRLSFFAGLALALLAPTFLAALVLEVILLLSWNPLVWME